MTPVPRKSTRDASKDPSTKASSRRAPAKAPAKGKAKPPAGARGARQQARKTQASTTKRKADAAAKRAKDARATGKRLTSAQTVLRDSMIRARYAQKVPWAAIAREAGVTVRSCQRVVEAARAVPSPLDAHPMELLEELARGFERSIGDYEAMAFAWADSNQSASLGAKKAADETRARLATLMANVGKLPSNLELFRSEVEMQRIAEKMLEFMAAVAEGSRSPEEAMEYLHELVMERGRRMLPQVDVPVSD